MRGRRPDSQEIDVREVVYFDLEQVRGISGPTRETPAQFHLPTLQHLRIVRILDAHVVRRTHRRLPVQELPEVLPTRGLPRKDVSHLHREPSSDEKRLPLVHVPSVAWALHDLSDALA